MTLFVWVVMRFEGVELVGNCGLGLCCFWWVGLMRWIMS